LINFGSALGLGPVEGSPRGVPLGYSWPIHGIVKIGQLKDTNFARFGEVEEAIAASFGKGGFLLCSR